MLTLPPGFAYHSANPIIARSFHPSDAHIESLHSLGFLHWYCIGLFPDSSTIDELKRFKIKLRHHPITNFTRQMDASDVEQLVTLANDIYKQAAHGSRVYLFDHDGTMTGHVCAILRLREGWADSSIVDEFRRRHKDPYMDLAEFLNFLGKMRCDIGTLLKSLKI